MRIEQLLQELHNRRMNNDAQRLEALKTQDLFQAAVSSAEVRQLFEIEIWVLNQAIKEQDKQP